MTLLADELVVMVAGYAHTRITPHSASIPIQSSLSGNVTWWAPGGLHGVLVGNWSKAKRG
jgi:hypothetical protein